MKTRSNRLAQIRQQIESKGYTLDYTETDGAKVYKNDEFIHVPEFDDLLLEYEQLRIEQDANTSDWDGSKARHQPFING